MLNISKFYVDGLSDQPCTDRPHPVFTYTVTSSLQNVFLQTHQCLVFFNDTLIWDSTSLPFSQWQGFVYQGPALSPFSFYRVELHVTDTMGETAQASLLFETGRMETPWKGKWISKGGPSFFLFSPRPLVFKKSFTLKRKLSFARIYATAFGIYELDLNGKKIGQDYFRPGFTSYNKLLQYQTYPLSSQLNGTNTLHVILGGGWAVADYTMMHKHKIYADRPALLLEIHLVYQDGSREIIKTDDTWEVTDQSNYRYGDFYMGEHFDARISLSQAPFKRAILHTPRYAPKILAEYGAPVRRQESFSPIDHWPSKSGGTIYDFGQNFAGIIEMTVEGKSGQKILIRHAEICVEKELFTRPLRLARARITYICKDGRQSYSPRLTYMGFRYIQVDGISPDKIQISAHALYSNIQPTGTFSCSNDDLNQLQNNISWSGKSNFVDIPTDCPQRDERMGWTGDISVFSPTAAFNFDMRRFLDKWLLDVIAEQSEDGGIPDVVPRSKYGHPRTTDCWADCAVMVPWSHYMAYGEAPLLERQYLSMKKHVDAELRLASKDSSADSSEKYIWRQGFHYGDWCSPGESRKQWQEKTPWVATAFMANSCRLLSQMAEVLKHTEDSIYYKSQFEKISQAYLTVHTNGEGVLHQEFQTGYVLPLYFDMVSGNIRKKMAERLSLLVEKNGNQLATGFCGTPYLLFALSDNGYADVAYRLLLQEKCPSWLYEVKAGATTVWERWDALRPDGTINQSNNMVSFNHYAYGAVGDWLYRRIAGIEMLAPGYKVFRIAPIPGGALTWAKASLSSPYGLISSSWTIEQDSIFHIDIQVPANTSCQLIFPDGTKKQLGSGSYVFSCTLF